MRRINIKIGIILIFVLLISIISSGEEIVYESIQKIELNVKDNYE